MNQYSGRIKAKKFYIDLHDLFNEHDYNKFNKYDRLMVKSQFHRSLAKDIPDNKIGVISNGI
jgi:hypothetical protein